VNQFSYGDRVIFDGAADAGQPGSRSIFVDAEEVRVADMTVGGGADYTFTGGGIHADAGNVQPDAGGVAHITDATGRLVKTGSGTLTLANGANTFTGGVQIDGGVLAFSRGDQLTTSDSTGITFLGGGTLRAAADMALDDTVSVASGVTGAIDSAGRTLALGGALTGAADSTLAKTGDGAVVLGADISGFSGTLAVRGGVLRAGAADVLTAAADATITLDAGATLDLDGHDQTLARLQGAGTVGLGPARLAMSITGDAGFAGGFTGAGTVVKQGAGKWTLSGSSSHTGGIILEEGRLGLAHNDALGSGTLAVAASSATLDIEADGLAVANDIAAGTNTLAIETNGRGVEFSGKISGDRLVIEGTGTLALSGNNTVDLEINNARTIVRRAESIADAVDIRDGSVLEFQDVGSGQVRGSLRGDRVLFTSSTLSLNGANTLRAFVVGADSKITAAAVGALGGTAADVTVGDGGWLKIVYPGTLANSMNVDGGALVFAPTTGAAAGMSTLALSGALAFSNGGEIRLDGIMPTGIYTAAVAYGGIPNLPAYDPHQGGMFMVADIVNGDTLVVTAYNKALEPGKDIVVGFDAMLAATRAVYTHVSEEFIAPLPGKEEGAGGRALWFRAIGSFAEYGDDAGHLGYTAASYGGIVGYDWISGRNIMAGIYAGYTAARLETTNNATTDMGLPHLGLYGAIRRGNVYATADFNLGSGSADTVRREDHGNIVTGAYNMDHAGAKIEVGCILPLFAKGGLRPSVGLHYMSLDFRHYAETGRGAVRLDNMGARTVQAVFGCDAGKEITTAWGLPGMVDLSAGWRQRVHTKITDAWATLVDYPNARLQIRGDEYDSSGVTAGVGLRMALSRRMLFALAYDFDYIPAGGHDNDTIRHTFNSVVRVSW
jgi:autotransporter-associated beta strand protein